MHREEKPVNTVYKEAAESNTGREQNLRHKGGQDFLKGWAVDGINMAVISHWIRL